jgi:hypothetical protein
MPSCLGLEEAEKRKEFFSIFIRTETSPSLSKLSSMNLSLFYNILL